MACMRLNDAEEQIVVCESCLDEYLKEAISK